jgi:tellurite resistance protein TerC
VPETIVWQWVVFAGLVAVLLALDLLVFHRHDRVPKLRESVGWTLFWISTGLAFNAVVWRWDGPHAGETFLTAFIVEKSLSMDNIFVFVVIFRFFAVPMMYQYRVLFWGILGAIVMRLAFILAGVELIHRFAWVTPVFGAFLIYTAYKLARHSGVEVHPDKNIVLRIARRFLPVAHGDHRQHGHSFFVRENASLCITPLFLVLLVIESSDVIFAVDSVPAVIGVIPKNLSRDVAQPPSAVQEQPTQPRAAVPHGSELGLKMFIAFSSNVFAILGLRALYFLLAGMVDAFRYLHYGLAAVLGFVGLKMLAEHWLGGRGVAPPAPWVSLLVVALLLAISIVVSIAAQRREAKKEEGRGKGEG